MKNPGYVGYSAEIADRLLDQGLAGLCADPEMPSATTVRK
jgi:hypothetical protein